jgi:hypothetical protein
MSWTILSRIVAVLKTILILKTSILGLRHFQFSVQLVPGFFYELNWPRCEVDHSCLSSVPCITSWHEQWQNLPPLSSQIFEIITLTSSKVKFYSGTPVSNFKLHHLNGLNFPKHPVEDVFQYGDYRGHIYVQVLQRLRDTIPKKRSDKCRESGNCIMIKHRATHRVCTNLQY